MKIVEPIRDIELISLIYKYLYSKNIRDYMLFYLGINTGLRISDLIKLKVYQVRGKDTLKITEKKTRKEKTIVLFNHVKKEIDNYLIKIPNNIYLFQNKFSMNHIGRKRAYYILKDVQRKFKLDNLGTHTLRKTFGYFYYKDTNDIATLMVIFNHFSQSTTLKYIGMSEERMIENLMKWGGIK